MPSARAIDVAIFYHEEDSYLMRFANSAISLNTNEHLIRLGHHRLRGPQARQLRADHRPGQTGRDEAGRGYRRRDGEACPAAELRADRPDSAPNPSPTKAATTRPWRGSATRSGWLISTRPPKAWRRTRSSSRASSPAASNIIAQINTRSEHTQYFRTSDAQVTVVLSHSQSEVGSASPSNPPRRRATWTRPACIATWPSCSSATRRTQPCSSRSAATTSSSAPPPSATCSAS